MLSHVLWLFDTLSDTQRRQCALSKSRKPLDGVTVNLVCFRVVATLHQQESTGADLPLSSQHVAAILILVSNECRNLAYL
jgi:hypothetical protein